MAFAWFQPVTQFIVIQGTATPLDGMWYPRKDALRALLAPAASDSAMTVYATGRYERRSDGVLAEIYAPRWTEESDGSAV